MHLKTQNKLKVASIFLLALLGIMLLAPPSTGQAADATAASIELSSDGYMADTPVTIHIYSVAAAGAEFIVYFTYDSSGTDTLETNTDLANITVDLGSSDDEWYHTMIFPEPTAGAYLRVHVTTSGAPDTDLTSAQIDVTTVSSLLPLTFIIELGVGLFLIGVIVAVVVVMYKRKGR